MYEVSIIVQENAKERRKAETSLEGEDRKEIMEQIPVAIEEIVKENGFKNPIAEYVLTRNGIYIDGEIDLKVKVNRNGVSVKVGELII